MYIRKTIIWGTSFVTTRNKNILWIKLDKSFFELDKDLYISPNTSQVIDQELLDDIESEIVNFTLKGDVILQGDFNARTGSMQEFAVHDDDNQFLEIPEDYEIDTENYRYSQDENTTNSRGRILIDLCTALSLRILNGRVVGDLTGKKTCFKYNGSSVVDYVIISSGILNYVNYFIVNALEPHLSDHCSLSFALMLNTQKGAPKNLSIM